MKLNNIWGYGQLFGFSGIDGKTRYYNDFVGTLTSKKIEIRFELRDWIKVYFPVKGRIKFNAITGDMIDAHTADGEFFITFASSDSLVGYSPVLPQIKSAKRLSFIHSLGADIWYNDDDAIALCYKEEGSVYKFSLYHSLRSSSYARNACKIYLNTDIEALKQERYAYYEKLPKCKNKKYERLYYKALSINKVNVHSPVGKIPCRWTTPDRVPHRNMWLWDSVFHALAIATYNGELAKDALRAVLTQAREDGQIPCMMNPDDFGVEQTQPQVLAWGVWEIYKKTGDKAFLKESVSALERYLEWDIKNRDENGNGLLEWFIEPGTPLRGGESGWDNSPRFDSELPMDAVDFSSFLAHDALCLSHIFDELGELERSKKWKSIYGSVKEKINTFLWDENSGLYYDRLFDGTFAKVVTPACFFPMFAGIPTKEQANKLVEILTDKNLLWTKMPLATVAKSHPAYSNDYWRGGVWLNCNYFVVKGLKEYGFIKEAKILVEKTLEAVNKWYKKTGTIFEVYDPENETCPFFLDKIGKAINPPDWRKFHHSISDFNWSASFTLLFIQDVLY